MVGFIGSLLVDFRCSGCLPQMCVHWSSENMTLIVHCFWKHARSLCWWALSCYLSVTFTYKRNAGVLDVKTTIGLSIITTTPVDNSNPDHNSWENEGSFISEWTNFGDWSPVIGQPIFLAFLNCGSAAQYASCLHWMMHWLQGLGSAGDGCGVWLTEQQVLQTSALSSSKRQQTRWKHPTGWTLAVDCQLDLLFYESLRAPNLY